MSVKKKQKRELLARPKAALTGYKHPVAPYEPCENPTCKGKGRQNDLYAKNTPKGLMWICFHCAKFVDRII